MVTLDATVLPNGSPRHHQSAGNPEPITRRLGHQRRFLTVERGKQVAMHGAEAPTVLDVEVHVTRAVADRRTDSPGGRSSPDRRQQDKDAAAINLACSGPAFDARHETLPFVVNAPRHVWKTPIHRARLGSGAPLAV